MSVCVWITGRCNMDCTYCYEVNKNQLDMSTETIKNTIDFVVKNGYLKNNKNISFHGGEPLLNFDGIKYFVEHIEALTGESYEYAFTTNGTILDDNICEYIKEKNFEVSVSIDGDRNVYDINRKSVNGKSTFDLAIKNAKKLRDNGIYVRIRGTFDTKTLPYLEKSVDYFVKEGFKCIVMAPNEFDENWNDSHAETLEYNIRNIYEKYNRDTELAISLIYYGKSEKSVCNYGKKSINIDSNGNIYPCTQTVGQNIYCIGNIAEGIDEDLRISLMNRVECRNEEEFICDSCENRNWCSGYRCRMLNELVNGNANEPMFVNCVMENINYSIATDNI